VSIPKHVLVAFSDAVEGGPPFDVLGWQYEERLDVDQVTDLHARCLIDPEHRPGVWAVVRRNIDIHTLTLR
jgi:hypothetical protein